MQLKWIVLIIVESSVKNRREVQSFPEHCEKYHRAYLTFNFAFVDKSTYVLGSKGYILVCFVSQFIRRIPPLCVFCPPLDLERVQLWSLKTRDLHFRGLAIISLDWYRVVWQYPLSSSFALLRQSFSFQQRQWPFYPAVLSKCQVLSTLLLIYSPKRSGGSGVDIHPVGSVHVGAVWYNSSRVTGLSFCPCLWFISSLVGRQTSLFQQKHLSPWSNHESNLDLKFL